MSNDAIDTPPAKPEGATAQPLSRTAGSLILFSVRNRMTKEAKQWCYGHEVTINPFNIVTALNALGYLQQNADDRMEADREKWANVADPL